MDCIRIPHALSVAEPNPDLHNFGKMDPDLHQSGKLDTDPY
jgi:hypothetical protein